MNKSRLKSYAPKARRDFIQAVTERAYYYGLSDNLEKIVPVEEKGDVAIIGGKAFPRDVGKQRKGLEERIKREGFFQVMEVVAYTWFNRFLALRYMGINNYLDHGFRVLSHPSGSHIPEIMEHAAEVSLPGLNRDEVVSLKLDGNKDSDLYRMILVAQCNALHASMPFLFEKIKDETELLLPDNLLHSDSIIRKLVTEIDEEDWQEIEIIGWLYQFYISEKKDQVIGKVVKSEDIPAATQLFTPNWIVKYMVQNSLGAQWLATYPHSTLKGQMEYYIEPAEQADEVKAQLAAITPSTLNPEELTLIDPASGSGHILVEAYELFKAIYLERGYRQRDVAQLILEKNLFGLDIDERAAQLTGFALMMKGLADDRRLFERGVKLNVMALVDSTGFDAGRLAQGVKLADYGLKSGDLTALKRMFEHATTFGSLIQVPEGLAAKLPALKQLSEATSQDLFVSGALKRLEPLVQQAELLAAQYDAVVANPPYIGGNGMNALVKKFVKDHFPDAKSNLFACFIEQGCTLVKDAGRVGVVAPYDWMFISSYERFRARLIDDASLTSLIQLEYNAFEPACIPVATFTLARRHITNLVGSYIKLSEFKGHENQAPRTLEAIKNPKCGWLYRTKADAYKKIPGSPVAYWVSEKIIALFENNDSLGDHFNSKKGTFTGDNDRFLRLWHEVDLGNVHLDCTSHEEAEGSILKWYPYNKGGKFRKWYGNIAHVINWQGGGYELANFKNSNGDLRSGIRNPQYFFRESISWSDITSSGNSFRYYSPGFISDSTGPSAYPKSSIGVKLEMQKALAVANSNLVSGLTRLLNPTMHFTGSDFSNLPFVGLLEDDIAAGHVGRLIDTGKQDWNAYERSWDFQSLPVMTASSEPTPTLESSFTAWITQNRDTIAQMKRLEEENNRLFIDAHGLADELTPDVPIEQITLTVNPAYRYGGKLSEEEQWTRFRQDTMEELVSFGLGCMMGRYSLDAPGLIYAHSGNDGFDASRYTTFTADDDGIIPVTDLDWFGDDAANRFEEFMTVAWSPETLEENLRFISESLAPKRGESPRDTIRRYLSTKFFKDHLKTYKKRPIYWLFSSGKDKAFECLIYLHRYNESTLSRMRNEYVIPLQGKYTTRAEFLAQEFDNATSASASNKLQKELDALRKKQVELSKFDEELRHYADQRIKVDLDDGVKANYDKFGNLLAEVKAITGKK